MQREIPYPQRPLAAAYNTEEEDHHDNRSETAPSTIASEDLNMEALVFMDSPMAEYIEGQFEDESGEQTWDIDNENVESGPETEPEPEAPISFAPPATNTVKSRLRALRPLKIQDPLWYRKARFKQVLSGGLTSKLATGENLQFIEQFRYILVASQLLNEHVNVSYHEYNKTEGPTPLLQSVQQSSNGASWFIHPGPLFWATSGLCVFVSALLLAWVLRVCLKKPDSEYSKSRAGTALVLSMMVAIYLFAHARRRLLRKVRQQAMMAATRFVEACQLFDLVSGNAITLIQEVELVSRGYRLSAPLPPISRMERNSQARRCTRLRWKILSSLTIAIPPQIRAIEVLRQFARERDLEKFYDIYDIRAEDLQELKIGIIDNEFEDMQSLKALKTLFHRLYTIRKIFTCHLLSLEANGGQQDHTQWRIVKDQLEIIGGLMANIGEEVRTFLVQEQDFVVPPTPKSAVTPANERLRSQMRKLNTLSQSVRGLQAKMHLLREETDRALQHTDDVTDFGPELLQQYDSIGSDVRSLVNEWESGRALLAMTIDRQSPSLNALRSPTMSSAPTLYSPRTSGNWNFDEPISPFMMARSSKRISMGSNSNFSNTTDEEEVYEGISAPGERLRSRLTREERIHKVQEERMKAAHARAEREAAGNMVKELQCVLEGRPQSHIKRRTRNFSAPEGMGMMIPTNPSAFSPSVSASTSIGTGGSTPA